MSKKRKNKSRLTKTDVNAICEMQKKISSYENFIFAMFDMIQHRPDLRFEPILMLTGTPMDDWMSQSWVNLREMKKELSYLKSEVEALSSTKK